MWKKILIVVLIVVVLGGGYFLISKRSAEDVMTAMTLVKTVEAKLESITTAVDADGSVIVEDEAIIKARLAGIIREVLVENGQTVRAGEAIFSLDDEPLLDLLENTRLTLEKARGNYQTLLDTYNRQDYLNRLKIEETEQQLAIAVTSQEKDRITLEDQKKETENRVTETTEALANAKEQLDKNKYLYNHQAIPYSKLQEAEDAYKKALRHQEQAEENLRLLVDRTIPNALNLAQLRVDNAKNQLEYLKATIEKEKISQSDLELSRIEIRKTEKQIQDIERDLARLITYSPIAGTVIQLELKDGDKVLEGVSVCKIADLNNLIVEAFVDEININQVEVGQEAVISSDAFAGELKGRVSFIAPVGTKIGNINKYRTEISINEGQGLLKPGMFVNTEVITSHREETIVVPTMALLGQEEKFVYIVTDGKAEKRIVEIGLKNISQVEVIGIEVGARIIVGPFSTLHNLEDGSPVNDADSK